jgi:hypothetical protein
VWQPDLNGRVLVSGDIATCGSFRSCDFAAKSPDGIGLSCNRRCDLPDSLHQSLRITATALPKIWIFLEVIGFVLPLASKLTWFAAL